MSGWFSSVRPTATRAQNRLLVYGYLIGLRPLLKEYSVRYLTNLAVAPAGMVPACME